MIIGSRATKVHRVLVRDEAGFKMKRVVSIVLAIMWTGCASHRIPAHTVLYTEDRSVYVWSYQPVEGQGYVARTLGKGDRVVLQGGAVVTFDGLRVRVNGDEVRDKDVVVQSDGRLVRGASIRSFD